MSTTERSKNEEFMIAVDIQAIAAFNWDGSLGARLRQMRQNLGLSRKALSQKTEECGRKVSEQYIQQLEDPASFASGAKKAIALSVSSEVLVVLCEALESDVTLLVRSVKIFFPIS